MKYVGVLHFDTSGLVSPPQLLEAGRALEQISGMALGSWQLQGCLPREARGAAEPLTVHTGQDLALPLPHPRPPALLPRALLVLLASANAGAENTLGMLGAYAELEQNKNAPRGA